MTDCAKRALTATLLNRNRTRGRRERSRKGGEPRRLGENAVRRHRRATRRAGETRRGHRADAITTGDDGATPTGLSKREDGGGITPSPDDLIAALARMTDEERTLTLIKAAHANPIRPTPSR